MKRRLVFSTTLFFLIGLFYLNGVAAESLWLASEETSLVGDNYSLSGTIFKIVIVLTVIITLIILLVRFLAQKNRGWNANRSIRLIGGVALGPNKSLQIVEIAGRIYIVGVGNEVQLVDKIDDEKAVESIVDSLTGNSVENGTVDQMMQWLKSRRNKSDFRYGRMEEQELDANADFQKLFQVKLNSNLTTRNKYIDEWSDETNPDRSNDKL